MSKFEELKNAKNKDDLAKLLGFKSKSLAYILYKISDEDKYLKLEILKKNGTVRQILSPCPSLKKLQRRLTNILTICEKEIFEKYKRPNLAHGFKKGYSIHTNAKQHKSKKYVLNFDLADFFPSINFGRVRGFFIKNNNFLLNENVATLIAQIACFDNQLPQGSPCSPIISNFIAHILDVRLVQLAKKYECKYTRYADDITFSTNKKKFPEELVFKNSDNIWVLGDEVLKILDRAGFSENKSKTRLSYQDQRQSVTGLVVNRKLNVRSEYYKLARAMAKRFFLKGEYIVPGLMSPKDTSEKNYISFPTKKINRLEGILAHIFYTRQLSDHRTLEEKQDKQSAIWKTYRDFVYLKQFGLCDKPLIICEGPSDSIYIKSALKRLYNDYPNLIQKEGEKFIFKIRFLKYSKIVRELLHLTGGTGELASFVGLYQKMKDKFPIWNSSHPVILLTDNDSGKGKDKSNKKGKDKSKKNAAAAVFGAVKQHTENKPPTIEDDSTFYHVNNNLYLVKTPHIEERQETCIEDLFKKSLIKESFAQLDGKTFNPENDADKNKHYGKMVFATKVVAKHWKDINFDGFKPLLERIDVAITNY